MDPGVNTPTTITHAYYVVPSEASRVQLIHTLLQSSAGDQSMVFCDQKYKVKRLAARLGGEPASVGLLPAITAGVVSDADGVPFWSIAVIGGHRCCGADWMFRPFLQVIHCELPGTDFAMDRPDGRAERSGATL